MPSRHHIATLVRRFHDMATNDPNHRYRSWEHCFRYFSQRTARYSRKDIDEASLHLAFYLASWGMYRGSSALLWKDYKIHYDPVRIILNRAHQHLWNLKFEDASRDDQIAGDVVSLASELAQAYHHTITIVNGKKRDFRASETLITKILLGTIGCTPACDQYFILGFRRQLTYSGFKQSFLRRAYSFYREHGDEFQMVQDAIFQQAGIRYPPMKLLDMYFWELGVES